MAPLDIKLIFQIFATCLGLIGLVFGLWQYFKAQQWKRMEFAATVIDKISTDPDLRLAVTFLDWRHRDIIVPEKYRDLLGGSLKFKHSHISMQQAFALESREIILETGDLDLKSEMITPVNLIYVDAFDRFFEFLAQLHDFINKGLIQIEDVRLMQYWVLRVGTLTVGSKSIFQDYLEHYDLFPVLNLITMFSDLVSVKEYRQVFKNPSTKASPL